MSHPLSLKWEKNLKRLFDEVDDYLEDNYGKIYPLHPARAKRGVTSNKAQDGLFNVGASFSAGYGSEKGRGYVVDIHMSTLNNIAPGLQKDLTEIVINKVKTLLPVYFPGKKLTVSHDGTIVKIYGDLFLGTV